MTDLEVMRDIISTLDSISVPVALTQQIAVPLADASGKMKALYSAILEALRQRQAQEKGE